MRTQTALLLVAMVTVAAFGLLISGLANAEQAAVGSGIMLVKGGGGMHHSGGHHGGNFFHGRGFYRGYYPYYGDYYYSTSPNCVWNGYKFVCYDSSGDYIDTY
jgi:hypothetical protein